MMPTGIDHLTYVIPGVVDGAVVKEQAERRLKKNGEVTLVHAHPREDAASDIVPCNSKCQVHLLAVVENEDGSNETRGVWQSWPVR